MNNYYKKTSTVLCSPAKLEGLLPAFPIMHLQWTFMKADGVQHLVELRPTGMVLGADHGLFTDPASPQRDVSLHLGRRPELLEADLSNVHEQASSVSDYT